jgi:DNA-binding beta-propeller fold protein YncE
MKIIKNKKLLIITSAFLCVVIAVTIFISVHILKDEDSGSNRSGEAEAVKTTKIDVYDGIWDPTRFTDELYYPIGITMLNGDLIIADSKCDRIKIIDSERSWRVGIPGQFGLSYRDSGAFIDGFRENAMFMKPAGVSVCNEGTIIIADTGNHAIRRLDEQFVITIAGSGTAGYQDGKEGMAQFNSPRSAVMCPNGDIYVADTMNHLIRKIDSDGNVTTFAGSPEQHGFVDGSLQDARFREPSGLYIDNNGIIYIADSANHAIRKIENGLVSTIVGKPGEINRFTGYADGEYVDGENEFVRFNFPRDIALLADGSILVADSMNHAIRLVSISQGKTITIAGNGKADQFYLSAENVRMTRPEGIYSNGEKVYVSDSFNNRVLAIPLTEKTLAGRPGREQMLALTGITIDSRYSYQGDIRVFIGDEWVDMGRVAPWNTADAVYVPIRPLFEALGATVDVNERTNTLTITINELDTVLILDVDYFILKGIAVTTIAEIERLFPYPIEYFPEFSTIVLYKPLDLINEQQ